MVKFKIELNENQANVVNAALDIYSRILVGQLHIIADPFIFQRNYNSERVDQIIQMLKKEIFPELDSNASYGIRNLDTDERAKIAYDIFSVLRNKMAWEKNPKGGITVNFDEPWKCSNEKELPMVEVVK